MLRIVPADLPAVTTATERLLPLVGDPPLPWRQELDRKVSRWRGTVTVAENEPGDDFAGPDEPEEVVDDAPEEAVESVELSEGDEARVRTRTAAAREDAVALLLTGLVRTSIDVTPVYLRRLFWARPLASSVALGLALICERLHLAQRHRRQDRPRPSAEVLGGEVLARDLADERGVSEAIAAQARELSTQAKAELKHAADDPGIMGTVIVDVMEPPFPAVAASDPVREAVELLAGDRQALLVTEHGRPTGIVTRADLLEALVS